MAKKPEKVVTFYIKYTAETQYLNMVEVLDTLRQYGEAEVLDIVAHEKSKPPPDDYRPWED